MDSSFRIYMAEEKDIPGEDKARLDGFLKGREEAEMLLDIKRAAYEAKVREMEARDGDE